MSISNGSVSLVGHILDITFPSNTTPPSTVPPPLVISYVAFPSNTAPPPTVVCPQVVGTGSLVGAVLGACIGTALLYTVILLVWVLWNKRHK